MVVGPLSTAAAFTAATRNRLLVLSFDLLIVFAITQLGIFETGLRTNTAYLFLRVYSSRHLQIPSKFTVIVLLKTREALNIVYM